MLDAGDSTLADALCENMNNLHHVREGEEEGGGRLRDK